MSALSAINDGAELGAPLPATPRSRRARARARIEARMAAAGVLLEQANAHAARAHDAALAAARRGDLSGLTKAVTGAARYGAIVGEQRAIHAACDERLSALTEPARANLPRTVTQAVDAAASAYEVADARGAPDIATEIAAAVASLNRAQTLALHPAARTPSPNGHHLRDVATWAPASVDEEAAR